MNATTGTAPTETDAEELRIFISEIARVSAQHLGDGWPESVRRDERNTGRFLI